MDESTSSQAGPEVRDRGGVGRVLVVGAGPAGLAAARALRARAIDYDHVERHDGVGGIWDIDAPGSPMYEAAHFISSRTLSGFDGFPMPDWFADYPSHREVLAYLRDFAYAYGLDDAIEFGTSVVDVDRVSDETGAGAELWRVSFDDGTSRRYRAVICCSGAQWVPSMPQLPGSFTGELMHSRDYRDFDQLAGRRVLVIGGGNSACDIIVDAARVAERAVISMRRGYWFIPKHIFGMPSDVFAEHGPHLPMRVQQRLFGTVLRLMHGRPSRWGLQDPDHRLFETHPVLNSNLLLALQHGDVVPRPGIEHCDGTRVTFTDGSSEEVDLVIAATGYRHEVPYAQRWLGDPQHPDLYLTAFSREHEGLFGLGFTETNSGAYRHFDALAQMVASHIDDATRRPAQHAEFAAMIRRDRPDLSGGIRFDASPRHSGYVDADALARYRRKVVQRMGWTAAIAPQVRPRALDEQARDLVEAGA